MNDLRVLTDAELDFVGGGATKPRQPTQNCGGELKLAEEILAVLFRVLEPRTMVAAKD
jgi:hypothetical protein